MKPYKVLLQEARKHKASTPVMTLSRVSNGVLTIYAYDIIGDDFFGDGLTPQAVTDAISAEPFTSITLRIDSPGGDPFAAVAVYNVLKSTGKPITVTVDGLAASAASLLAMVGDQVLMGEGAMLMIHNAWAVTAGNAIELRKAADDLEKISATMRDVYAKRTGLSAEEVQQIMDAETWLKADEAIIRGFADGMAVPDKAPVPSAYLTKLRAELEVL